MNRIQVIEWFSKVEKETRFNNEEGDIWPILKSDLFFSWYRQSSSSSSNLSRKKKPLYTRVRSLFFSLVNICKYRRGSTLYAGFSAHRTVMNDLFVNKFFRAFTNDRRNVEMEYGQIDTRKQYENYKDILFLEHLEPLVKLIGLFVKKRSCSYKNIKDVIKRFDVEVCPLAESYIKKFESKLHLIRAYAIFFSYLLRKLKVEKVYVLCYYNIQMFALVYAANKLGIITYDVQHGSQGPLHPMYYFNGLKSGTDYPDTLPSNFWCWDAPSASSLRSWLPSNRMEKVENRGNPWISYTIQHYGDHFKHAINRTKNNILITLQEPVLSGTLLEVIENLDSQRFVWWLRFHPRMMEKRDYWKDYFARKNIQNVEIDKACEIPL